MRGTKLPPEIRRYQIKIFRRTISAELLMTSSFQRPRLREGRPFSIKGAAKLGSRGAKGSVTINPTWSALYISIASTMEELLRFLPGQTLA
jgi:hypothetical protein